jgi:cellobiose dehydrogenase (acceptor)
MSSKPYLDERSNVDVREFVIIESYSLAPPNRMSMMGRALLTVAVAAFFQHVTRGQNTTNPNCTTVSSEQTYDYVVIGSGAGGIPVADRLSEAGHSVLLVEKGPLSSGRWNGTMKPAWLEGTNLTRFDVPGLFNQIWADPTGVACDDLDVMAGW